MQLDFSPWYRWPERGNYPGIKHPGVYVVAISPDDIGGAAFSLRPEVVYVGMTNESPWGLDGRLWEFDSTISLRRCQHGGADRVVFKHRDYEALCKQLFVALWHMQYDPTSKKPDDLRGKGEVARAEYECFARAVEQLGSLPEFNRSDSPKYTKRVKEF
jgi:hypothetical protein